MTEIIVGAALLVGTGFFIGLVVGVIAAQWFGNRAFRLPW